MTPAAALLGLLEGEPAHGYTLKQRYDDLFTPVKPLAFGQVYASLARFEKHGWIDVAGVEAGDGPDRRRYQITEAGVSEVDAFVYTPQPAPESATRTLFARVSLALLSGRDTAQVLDAQRAVHLARMRELTAARRTAEDAHLLAIAYELAHVDADLRWIEDAAARLVHRGAR